MNDLTKDLEQQYLRPYGAMQALLSFQDYEARGDLITSVWAAWGFSVGGLCPPGTTENELGAWLAF